MYSALGLSTRVKRELGYLILRIKVQSGIEYTPMIVIYRQLYISYGFVGTFMT